MIDSPYRSATEQAQSICANCAHVKRDPLGILVCESSMKATCKDPFTGNILLVPSLCIQKNHSGDCSEFVERKSMLQEFLEWLLGIK